MKSLYGLSLLMLLVGISICPAQEKASAIANRDDVFGPDKIWTLHIKLGTKEYQAMQPKGGGFGFGFPKKDIFPKKDEKKEEKKAPDVNTDVHKNKGFGIEFPYVVGEIEFEGTVVKDVGIRYKGNSTYQASQQGLKRPFKIDINHFVDTQKLLGMSGFGLGNGVMDASRIKEALGYAIFRAAKVPAPRTAFIKLYLTVADKHDKTYVGLYTLLEPVDKTFLKNHYKSDKGMLLKPERIQGLPYFGESWNAYKDRYNPKREPTKAQTRRLIEFTKLVNQADDAAFKKQIGDYLDVDGFLRFTAANSLVANLDSFFGVGHNYYLYLNPKTDRFSFIPWDMDLSFGGFFSAGADQTDWSIAQPYMGKNRLTERILAIKEHNDAYRGHLRKLTATVFSEKEMNALIAVMEATIKDALAKEPQQKGFGFGPAGGKQANLRDFIKKRNESVVAQLDGRSQGKQIAGFGFGPPGGGGKGPGFGGFGIGNFLAKPIVEFVDANKDNKVSLDEFKIAAGKLFKEAGGDDKTPMAEAELIDTINRLMPAPKGFGDFKPPPPPKGFGPGKRIAGAIYKFADAGNVKKLSREQFLASAEKLFKQWDKDKAGYLDEKKLQEGLNQFVPPPEFGPGIGPPPPGDTKKDLPKK